MADKPIDSELLVQAFRATGRHLEWDSNVQLLIVGAAALAMTHSLPPERTHHGLRRDEVRTRRG